MAMASTNYFMLGTGVTNLVWQPNSMMLTNIIIYPTLTTTNALQYVRTNIVTVTNVITVAAPPTPSVPIHIGPAQVIGVVICLLCLFRIWWLRKVDKRLKLAQAAAYDYYLSIKNPPQTRRLYE